jgi:hypothetical protein
MKADKYMVECGTNTKSNSNNLYKQIVPQVNKSYTTSTDKCAQNIDS